MIEMMLNKDKKIMIFDDEFDLEKSLMENEEDKFSLNELNFNLEVEEKKFSSIEEIENLIENLSLSEKFEYYEDKIVVNNEKENNENKKEENYSLLDDFESNEILFNDENIYKLFKTKNENVENIEINLTEKEINEKKEENYKDKNDKEEMDKEELKFIEKLFKFEDIKEENIIIE
jgi:hypothetical protein